MLLIAYGLAQGTRRAIAATLGILSANALYFALSATSLGAVLVTSRTFFTAVKWAGAAYLVTIAVRALVGQASLITVSRTAPGATSARAIYMSGLALQLANP